MRHRPPDRTHTPREGDVPLSTVRAAGGSGGTRKYHSPRRSEQAAATRQAIIGAARELFVRDGYQATTVADVADRARVAVDTVYATVGRKPALLREVLETALSGTDRAVPGPQRDYVERVRASPTLHAKLEAYVAGLIPLQQRLAPVFLAIREAAQTEPDARELWQEISSRRAANMRRFVADLRGTGELRLDLSDDDMGDLIWSMNGPEYWALLVQERGWSPERFASHLVDCWERSLRA